MLHCSLKKRYSENWKQQLLRERAVTLTRYRLATAFMMSPAYILAKGEDRELMDRHRDLLVQLLNVIEERLKRAGIDVDSLCG